jgi:hypothetical protein
MNTKKITLVACVASVALYGSHAYARLDEQRLMTIEVQYAEPKPGTPKMIPLETVTLTIEKSETIGTIKDKLKIMMDPKIQAANRAIGQVRKSEIVKLFVNDESLGDHDVTIENLLRDGGPLVEEENVIKGRNGKIVATISPHMRKTPGKRR